MFRVNVRICRIKPLYLNRKIINLNSLFLNKIKITIGTWERRHTDLWKNKGCCSQSVYSVDPRASLI